MGKMSDRLLMKMISDSTVQAVSDLIDTSQFLGGLAKVIMDEGCAEFANPQQIVEAAARCIDTVELIVEAARPSQTACGLNEKLLNKELKRTKRKLNEMRNEILGLMDMDT